ncbi:MAG: SUMF1/EgtB/PvdO family nonheme iron enzyme, partial [Bacteroidota bacterium]
GEKPDLEIDSLVKWFSWGVLVAIFALLFYFPSFENCKGDLVELGEKELCIKNPREQLIYREFQIRDLVEKNDFEPLDSVEKVAIAEFYYHAFFAGSKDTLSFQQVLDDVADDDNRSLVAQMSQDTSIVHFYNNIATDFFNVGVPFYNQSLELSFAGGDAPVFCEYFDAAIFYENLISAGQLNLLLNPVMQSTCNSSGGQDNVILVSVVGGRVFDATTKERIEGVEVSLFGNTKTTDTRGRYTFKVPVDSEEAFFPITLKKEGYQAFSKNIARTKMEIFSSEATLSKDLEDIFLEKADTTRPTITTSCNTAITLLQAARLRLTDLQERELRTRTRLAYQIIQDYPGCDGDATWDNEKRLLQEALEGRGYLLDERDGQLYKTVKIGNQTWMAENLSYDAAGSICPENFDCGKNGRFYGGQNSNTYCPQGWRVPSDLDFEYLINSVGGDFENMLENTPDRSPSQKAVINGFEALVSGGNSGFDLKLSGIIDSVRLVERGVTGVLISSKIITDGESRARVVFGLTKANDEKTIIKSPMPLNKGAMASCRCVAGAPPTQSPFSVAQQSAQERSKITLDIELVNTITRQPQTGYRVEVQNKAGVALPVQPLESGNEFSVEVEENKAYTIIAKVGKVEKKRQIIYAKAEPKRTYQRITMEVGLPVTSGIDLPDLEMVDIPGGTFRMGNDYGEDDEKPAHSVTVPAFKMQKYEVTQRLWEAVMGNNPSEFKDCERCPVGSVSWNDAQEFIRKLNALTGLKYRLPSESEWEYAAKGGEEFKYAGSDDLSKVGWYDGNSDGKTHPVGELQPNQYGLYDMSGNVWEWCEDTWNWDYTDAPTDGSAWIGDGSRRVFRSGSWRIDARYCRVSNRDFNSPDYRGNIVGFRLVLGQ